MIGAVTSNRSSRADKVPHANTSAATIARSDSLIDSPAEIPHPPTPPATMPGPAQDTPLAAELDCLLAAGFLKRPISSSVIDVAM